MSRHGNVALIELKLEAHCEEKLPLVVNGLHNLFFELSLSGTRYTIERMGHEHPKIC